MYCLFLIPATGKCLWNVIGHASLYKTSIMAEINTSGGSARKGPGVKKGKKLSTRVDLTPMVDLGFLLITFFIFTTTLSRPHALSLNVPKDSSDSMLVKRSAVITIIPADHDKVYYYEGDSIAMLRAADMKAIGSVILDKKMRTDTAWFQVIIKPTKDATYRNVVDILDEMLINEVHHYALVDISPGESQLIHSRFR